MPYKSLEAKRARAREYGKEYFQRKKNDPVFREDRKRRRKEWSERNKEYERQYRRALWEKIKQDPERLAQYYQRQREYAKVHREKVRRKLVSLYGGKCECCGETEPLFLTLDHVQGGGSIHFRKRGSGVYKEAMKEVDKSKCRVLCWNCNLGRERNNGICPHEQKKEV